MTFEDHKRCLFEVDDDVDDGGDSEEVGDDFDYDAVLNDEELKLRARLMVRSVIETIHGNAAAATVANIAGVKFTQTCCRRRSVTHTCLRSLQTTCVMILYIVFY